MARRKMDLDERIDRYTSQLPKDFLPNEEGAAPIKINDDVRKDFSRARWETAHLLNEMNEKYKKYENETGMKDYAGSLDGIVGYANDLAKAVNHDEYREIKHGDPNAEGRVIHYISLGLMTRSQGKMKPDAAMAEARKKFHEYTHPEKDKKPDRETLQLLKDGLMQTHSQVVLRRPQGIFASYATNEEKRKQLAALVAAITEMEDGAMYGMTDYQTMIPTAVEHATNAAHEFASKYVSHPKDQKAEHNYKSGDAH